MKGDGGEAKSDLDLTFAANSASAFSFLRSEVSNLPNTSPFSLSNLASRALNSSASPDDLEAAFEASSRRVLQFCCSFLADSLASFN